jgi:hypothetical protein
VAVREKLSTWECEAQDLGARGCRIALQRQLAPGALVQLAFDVGAAAEPLVVLAQVAWATKAAPLTAGVRFLAVPREAVHAQPGYWLDRLVAAQLRRAAASGRGAAAELGPLADVRLHLCGLPGPVPSAAEQAVVTLARGEGAISAAGLAADRLGAVAELLERGVVTVALGPGASARGGAAEPVLRPARPLGRIEVARTAAPAVRAVPRVITPPPLPRVG